MINKIKKSVFELLLKNPKVFDSYRIFTDKFKSKSEEKLFLRNAIVGIKDPIRIIQIGANDGLRSDPVRELIIDFKCKALLIEADPVCYEILKENYSYLKEKDIIFLNVAVVPNKEDNIGFYSLSEEFRSKLKKSEQVKMARKASTDKSLFIDYLNEVNIENPENAVVQQEVETKKLDDLFDVYFEPNVLVIDTEGLDWSLMQSLDLRTYSPDVIYFESKFPTDVNIRLEVLTKLEESGYKIQDFGNNIGCQLMDRLVR
ncbi:FkbM family methyltransferase [Rhodohalobacter sp. 614A]|uniref:FkbM family methyltransferase n=1 Tax=Rhodohalobacter sp. 614A TaxID=2908649 RepID=UPI001F02F63C|nr:FkbM family methyltransferase [Rhodohalobacter sp. 614A]